MLARHIGRDTDEKNCNRAYIRYNMLRPCIMRRKGDGGACCGATLQNGIFGIAINTKYVFAGIPQNFDMSDIDGMRKYYVSSLERMGSLLDIIAKNPSFFGD